jgi:SAM-dependent methyltransferase
MHPDVKHLHDFYHTRLGGVTARLITARIHEIWQNLNGLSVLGLGYAAPFIDPLVGKPASSSHHKNTGAQCARVIALMPARQGVMAWPDLAASTRDHRSGNLSGLVDELQLPLPDASFDRIILAHILENTEQTRVLLREVWRVLTPGGRLIVITPNRQGMWAQFERTPFGTGRPHSRPQLSEMLAHNMLVPPQWRYALHMPPFDSPVNFKLMRALERPGHQWWRRLAGVLVMEAEKQIYAVTPSGAGAKKVRRRVPVAISNEVRIPPQKRNASRRSR